MKRVGEIFFLLGCLLPVALSSGLTHSSIIAVPHETPGHLLDEAKLTYELEELHVFPTPTEADLSIEGGMGYIKFNQKFICYMGSADVITLEMERRENEITIKEKYPLNYAVRGTALYNVTGTIQELEEGEYTVNFIYIDKAGDTTEKLYERSLHVGEKEELPLLWISLGVAILVTGFTVGILYYKKMRKSRRPSGH